MFSVVPKRESIQIYTPNTVTVSHCVNESTRKPKAGVGGWVVTVSQPIGSSSCGHLKCSLYPRSAVTHLATWHTAASQSMWVSFCFVFLSATAGGLWNLSSLTRDQPRSRRQWKQEVLTTGPPGNSSPITTMYWTNDSRNKQRTKRDVLGDGADEVISRTWTMSMMGTRRGGDGRSPLAWEDGGAP